MCGVLVVCACVVCLWCDTTTSVCVPLVNALCEVTELLVVAQFHNLQKQPCFLVAIP